MPTLLEHLSSLPVFRGVHVARFLVLCVVFLYYCLSFPFFPLYCLSFFDLRLLTTSLVSSNHSYVQQIYMTTMTPMVSVLLKYVTTSILEWYK